MHIRLFPAPQRCIYSDEYPKSIRSCSSVHVCLSPLILLSFSFSCFVIVGRLFVPARKACCVNDVTDTCVIFSRNTSSTLFGSRKRTVTSVR